MARLETRGQKHVILATMLALILSMGCLRNPEPLNNTAFMPNLSGAQNGKITPPPGFTGTKVGVGTGKLGQVVCILNGVSDSAITIYIDGNNMRSEYFFNETNETIVSLVKGDEYYLSGRDMGTLFENCTWVRFDKEGYNSTANLSELGLAKPNMNSMEKPKCKPGSFDAGIFEVAGTVCNFTEIMAQSNSANYTR